MSEPSVGEISDSNVAVFDPSDAPCLNQWNSLSADSPCPYAASANVWGAPDWDDQAAMDRNVHAMLPYFLEYVRQEASGVEKIDGFVVKPDSESFPAETMEELASSFRELITSLSDNDPHQSSCKEPEINSPEWEFNFDGEPVFISVFSPLYSESHVRHAEKTFIFFQLQHTFDRHGVGDSVRRTPRVLRILSSIKAGFESAGYEYPEQSVDDVPKAHKYLSPRWIGDAATKWWQST